MQQLPSSITSRPVEMLLVEDNPDHVRLTQEALLEGKVANRLNVVSDGMEALRYLRRAVKDCWIRVVSLPAGAA